MIISQNIMEKDTITGTQTLYLDLSMLFKDGTSTPAIPKMKHFAYSKSIWQAVILKGCVRYIFASFVFMSKREHL